MDSRTLKALKGSIRKWEKIVAGTGEDDSSFNCPLCQEFALPEIWSNKDRCAGCPVAADSGPGCEGSPYVDWVDAREDRDNRTGVYNVKATDDETVMCAVLELEYLKSLLPRKRNG